MCYVKYGTLNLICLSEYICIRGFSLPSPKSIKLFLIYLSYLFAPTNCSVSEVFFLTGASCAGWFEQGANLLVQDVLYMLNYFFSKASAVHQNNPEIKNWGEFLVLGNIRNILSYSLLLFSILNVIERMRNIYSSDITCSLFADVTLVMQFRTIIFSLSHLYNWLCLVVHRTCWVIASIYSLHFPLYFILHIGYMCYYNCSKSSFIPYLCIRVR